MASSSALPTTQYGCIAYVAHNIYLGNRFARNRALLEEQGITRVLSIHGRLGNEQFKRKGDNELKSYQATDDLAYLGDRQRFVQLDDITSQGSSIDERPVRELYERHCKDFLEEGKRNGERILVHCAQGRSRSVAIANMYLCASYGLTMMEGMLLLFSARLDVIPQDTFIDEMKSIEEDRDVDGNAKESFPFDVLPGEEHREETQAKSATAKKEAFLKVSTANGRFAQDNKNTLILLLKKTDVGAPLEGELYKKRRFKHFFACADSE